MTTEDGKLHCKLCEVAVKDGSFPTLLLTPDPTDETRLISLDFCSIDCVRRWTQGVVMNPDMAEVNAAFPEART